MNQQEDTNNHLQEEKISPIIPNESLENSENKIVYIAELNGEFFTVDYNQDDDNPTVTPLKIVEFMNASEVTSEGQLASLEINANNQIQPLDDSAKPASIATPQSKKLSTNKSIAVGIGLGLLFAWGGAKLLTAKSTSEPVASDTRTELSSQARSVTIKSVESSAIDRTVEVSGTAEALELIPITSQATGLQIQEILVDEGAVVTKGQILARLKNDTIQAEQAQAQAAVDGARARLNELKAGTRSEELARSRERVNRAIAGVEQAQSDLELVSKRVERNSNLQAEGAISRDRLDEINNQERISKANLTQAEASLREANQELQQLQAGARPEVISQAEAELARVEGQLQYAAVQLDNTIIKAVTDGIVAERNAKIGDLTSPSQTLFTIIENGSLELGLLVPETDLNQIKPGQKVKIFNNRNNSAPIIGQVREIDPIVNRESRQAIVKVNLPSDTNLQPGMFLEATITTSQAKGLTVPIKALLPQTDDRAIAYVIKEDNTVEARRVKMGEILSDNKIEVLDGLKQGESVVVKGATYLKDGDAVSVEKELGK